MFKKKIKKLIEIQEDVNNIKCKVSEILDKLDKAKCECEPIKTAQKK